MVIELALYVLRDRGTSRLSLRISELCRCLAFWILVPKSDTVIPTVFILNPSAMCNVAAHQQQRNISLLLVPRSELCE